MKEKPTKQVFVTKYALTMGVLERRAEIVDGKYARAGGLWCGPSEWHETKEAAVQRVGEMIAAKRKSMAKIEAKLAKIERSIADGALEIKSK